MYYRCPVCNGKGKVESEFGGGSPHGAPFTCPACEGEGMQYVHENKVSYPDKKTTMKKIRG